MPEQPPKLICEICGGAHPTSEHQKFFEFEIPHKERLRLISGGKETPLRKGEASHVVVIEGAKIEEEKVFSKGEVQGLIEQIVKKEGIKKDDLEVYAEQQDKAGNLIRFDVRVKPNAAKDLGWKSIEYSYELKGRYGKFGSYPTSAVMEYYNTEDPITRQGGIMAEYRNGEWIITPGNISPRVDVAEEEWGRIKRSMTTCEICGGSHPTSAHITRPQSESPFIGIDGKKKPKFETAEKEQIERSLEEVRKSLENKYGSGWSWVILKYDLEHIIEKFGGLSQLRGKKILDIGCGSILPAFIKKQILAINDRDERGAALNQLQRSNRDIPEELFWGGRDYEPWLCRALMELGGEPIGIDIGNLEDEQFEHYGGVDLKRKEALGFLPDHSVDAINAHGFFSSPTAYLYGEEKKKVKNELEKQARRLLKEGGLVLWWN